VLPPPPWLDHSNYTWRRVQVMKLLIMQFSPTSRHFIPVLPEYWAPIYSWKTVLYTNAIRLTVQSRGTRKSIYAHTHTDTQTVFQNLISRMWERVNIRKLQDRFLHHCNILSYTVKYMRQ
jgi:hypothetical protein